MTVTKVLGAWRLFAMTAVAFPALLLFWQGLMRTSSNSRLRLAAQGVWLCNGSVAYNLNTLLSSVIVSGTQTFAVTDTMDSFSFVYTGSAGDNGSRQINGGATSFF